MERQYIAYILLILVVVLVATVVAYFVMESRGNKKQLQARRDDQGRRERKALQNRAELSDQYRTK